MSGNLPSRPPRLLGRIGDRVDETTSPMAASRRSPPRSPPRDRDRSFRSRRDYSPDRPRGPPVRREPEWRPRDEPHRRREPSPPPAYFPPREVPDAPWASARPSRRDDDRSRPLRDDRERDLRREERSRPYDGPPRRGGPSGSYRDYPPMRSPSPPPRAPYPPVRSDYPPSRDDRYRRRSRSRSPPPPRRSPSPRYRRGPSPPRSYRRRPASRSRSPPPPPTSRRRSPGPSYRPPSQSQSPARRRSPLPPPRTSPESKASYDVPPIRVSDAEIKVKPEPTDDVDMMDIDRPPVGRQQSPVIKTDPANVQWGQEAVPASSTQTAIADMSKAGSLRRGPFGKSLGTSNNANTQPLGPRKDREREHEAERSPPGPLHVSTARVKQEASPQDSLRLRSPSLPLHGTPASRSPAMPSPRLPQPPTKPFTKPIPVGPRAKVEPKAEPPPVKSPTFDIPVRRRDWHMTQGAKEREALSQRLAALQKSYHGIAVDVLKTGWDMDVALIEVEGARHKRTIAEKQLERAAKGYVLLDEPVSEGSGVAPAS